MNTDTLREKIDSTTREIEFAQERAKVEINDLIAQYKTLEARISERGVQISNDINKLNGKLEAYKEMLDDDQESCATP